MKALNGSYELREVRRGVLHFCRVELSIFPVDGTPFVGLRRGLAFEVVWPELIEGAILGAELFLRDYGDRLENKGMSVILREIRGTPTDTLMTHARVAAFLAMFAALSPGKTPPGIWFDEERRWWGWGPRL